jgi:hypothetical protein
MGSAPQQVNYKGEVLTDEMKNYLFGSPIGPGDRRGGAVSADRAKEILENWMYGIKPKPIDPSEAIARESAVGGLKSRAAAGTGMTGLFGFAKYIGDSAPKLEAIQPLDAGPMAPGVPYSVPPLPKLRPMASGGG